MWKAKQATQCHCEHYLDFRLIFSLTCEVFLPQIYKKYFEKSYTAEVSSRRLLHCSPRTKLSPLYYIEQP